MQSVFSNLAEELSIPLRSSEKAHSKHTGSIDREQGSDGIELACEDLEHYESE